MGWRLPRTFPINGTKYLKVYVACKWLLCVYQRIGPTQSNEAGWRQRNHPYPGLASFRRCNGRKHYYHVKDRLSMCKKGCCLVRPSSYSCCHEIDGTEKSQKYMARITGCKCAGNSERRIQRIERNMRSTLQSQYIASTCTQNEKALFTFTGHSRDHRCFLFFWAVETIRSILR